MMKPGFEGHARALRRCVGLGLFACVVACSSSTSNKQPASPEAENKARTEVDDRMENATGTVPEFRQNMPDSVASQTQCVAVIPGLVKGGFLVGGATGKGFAACKMERGWSPPAPITIGGGSIGAQVGVQATDWLMLVQSDTAKRSFLQGRFRIGVDASASAGPVGKGRGAASDKAGGDVLSYSRSRGLFAGAVLDGSTISQDEDSTRVLYGNMTPLRDILTGGAPMPADPAAKHFVTTLHDSFEGAAVSSR
jgi:lipid-binding SYLF domain-containing protein